ncbi:MAG: iron-sulfur cluster assembly scaffold protein [Sphingomonas sp.]
MNAPLYNNQILRLAATVPPARLASPMASAERRSPVCGSRVIVDVNTDASGRVSKLGLVVRACALGQASASLMAAHAVGKDAASLGAARDALAAWLGGKGPVPDWPGLDIFAPALPHTARHASIRLAFEAVTQATEEAMRR